MSTTVEELRSLADQLEVVALQHVAYPMVADIVKCCCNHLRAEARVRELQHQIHAVHEKTSRFPDQLTRSQL